MADNVAITAGAGTTIATDDVSTVHYQRIKLVDGTLDGTDAIPGTAARGLSVDPRAKVVRLSATPTVSTSPAYTAKDAVGGLMTFASAARASGGSITIQSVQVVDKGQQMADLDLVLFDRSVTAPTDNAIFAPSDTEAAQVVDVIPLPSGLYADLSTNSVIAVNRNTRAVLNGTDLFGVLVTRGTPTYTSTTDIVVTVTIVQD